MRKILYVFLFLALNSYPLWHQIESKNRIKIKIEPFREEISLGIILKGYDFYKMTGFSKIDVNSISLWDENEEIPLQIEEMDGTGKLLGDNSNGILDDDDRIVFLIKGRIKEQTLYFYYNGSPLKKNMKNNKLKIEEKNGEIIPLIISKEKFTIGIKGGGFKEGPSTNRIENYSRGAIPLLIWQDLIFFDFRRAWTDFFPRSIGTGPGNYMWTDPKIIYKGDVRTVIEIKCNDYKEEKDGVESFKGDIIRYISIWNDLPVIDFEEYVYYKSANLNYEWKYLMGIPVGKKIDENDVFITTLADNVYTLSLNKTIERIKKYQAPYQTFYSTDNPEEGWFAVYDPNEKNGMAVFYEKMEKIRERKEWVTYRPPLHPSISIRTTPYDKVEVNLYFIDRALRAREKYKRELRYILLKDEKPEVIREYYKYWAEPLEKIVNVEFPETLE